MEDITVVKIVMVQTLVAVELVAGVLVVVLLELLV